MDSYEIDNTIVQKIIKDKDFPRLVSFPRTGSHWLRMVMELYFDKPSLVRVFFQTPTFTQENSGYKASDFTCYHVHDLKLKEKRINNIFYLYREPVATIYSQMNYCDEDLSDKKKVLFWSEKYARHLKKWLLDENFTKKKTIITYEDMCSDFNCVFKEICAFLEFEFDEEKLTIAKEQVTKNRLKEKTKHDDKVVNLSDSYADQREKFKNEWSEEIYGRLGDIDAKLPGLFGQSTRQKSTLTSRCLNIAKILPIRISIKP